MKCCLIFAEELKDMNCDKLCLALQCTDIKFVPEPCSLDLGKACLVQCTLNYN